MIIMNAASRHSHLLSRGLLLLLIWWLLSNGAAVGWWVGLPAVALALFVSNRLLPPLAFRWFELLRFLPFFLWHSLLGGLDVARRVVQPSLPIAPALLDYTLQLPPGPPRVLMAAIVNLLPGTLCIDFDGDVLHLHVLDGRQSCDEELRAVEQRVARIFAIAIDVGKAGIQS